jgi:hypothetical protein
MNDLTHLADLLRQRNAIEAQIALLIGRPALSGHIGEFIASRIFGIDLFESAINPASDGMFTIGLIAGHSVNIKLYGKLSGILDLIASETPQAHPDYYLVMTGPGTAQASSRGSHAPVVIESVFLFHADSLLASLRSSPRAVKIGIATSVRKHIWQAAMIYPEQVNQALILTDEQRTALRLFAPQPT